MTNRLGRKMVGTVETRFFVLGFVGVVFCLGLLLPQPAGAAITATVSPSNGPFAGGNRVVVANASANIGSGADITNITVFGARATITGQGTGLKVETTGAGARLQCAFQRLEGEVTPEAGLWLTSTITGQPASRFRVMAAAIGRGDGAGERLAEGGTVTVEDGLVRWVRPALVEEYSVSVDGVRQDFVIAKRPSGAGELRVELAVSGASAELAADGARLTLAGSGRRLAYDQLRATDAANLELPARVVVAGADRMFICVDDRDAAYPLRIDPTFSDENWISMGGVRGANGTVRAAIADGAGNLYIGGDFIAAGTAIAKGVA